VSYGEPLSAVQSGDGPADNAQPQPLVPASPMILAEPAPADVGEVPAEPPLATAGEVPSTAPTAPSEPVVEPPPPAPLPDPSLLPLLGSVTRPQIDPALAATLGVLEYLAYAGNLATGLTRDDWDPTAGGGDSASFIADYVVASTGGSHTTVQAAITAAVAAGGTERRFIEVAAGSYREVVCVPAGAPPITLYGTSPNAAQTRILFDNNAGKAKAAGTSANPCNPNAAATTFGTSGSATVAVMASDFIALNLTLGNDTDEDEADGSVQAVALLVQGDRVLFDNVRVLGNQGTLLAKSPNVDTVARSFFRRCYIEGDSEFILGRGTLVLDGCTIHSLTDRIDDGTVLAASTDARNPHGFLINAATFSADADASSLRLGRAWDENQDDVASYSAAVPSGVYPNGQVLVRNSTLGAHIESSEPWRSASSSNRPYASAPGELPANRLYEFGNLGPGSASLAATP
jgi:pectinesterase